MSINPSPLPDASATQRGAVTTGDQSLGGAGSTKTFASIIVGTLATLAEAATNLVRAVGAALVLRSDLGAGASDVAVKAGTSVADGSVNAGAKVFSVRTGLGGTEIEKLYVSKAGYVWTQGGVYGSTSSSQSYAWCDSGAARLVYSTSQIILTTGLIRFYDGSNYSLHVNYGRLDQSGTDSSGTPGAATINKPIGTSAIAAGASSVVITNSLVAAGDWVMITPHARDATCKELIAVCGAGTITVSGSAAATAALAFSWEVKKRI